jgi:hypothetical protein
MATKDPLHHLVGDLPGDQTEFARVLLEDLRDAADVHGPPLDAEALASLNRGLADIAGGASSRSTNTGANATSCSCLPTPAAATDAAIEPGRPNRSSPKSPIRLGLPFPVAHCPTGASKWNPGEHRLFSEISKNWAADPLDSYEKLLGVIQSTKTKNGLSVSAQLDIAI